MIQVPPSSTPKKRSPSAITSFVNLNIRKSTFYMKSAASRLNRTRNATEK